MIIIQTEFLNLNHLLIIKIGKTEFPSHSKDWRKFEYNNKTIALNKLYVPYNKKQDKEQTKQGEEQTKQDEEQIKRIRQVYISNTIMNAILK